jgi:hypothetical protein
LRRAGASLKLPATPKPWGCALLRRRLPGQRRAPSSRTLACRENPSSRAQRRFSSTTAAAVRSRRPGGPAPGPVAMHSWMEAAVRSHLG